MRRVSSLVGPSHPGDQSKGGGSWFLLKNLLRHTHQQGWRHVHEAAELSCSAPGGQLVPPPQPPLNVSVNAVRGEDKNGNDPHVEQVEAVSITAAFISAGWFKMIRVPELMLILGPDWL